MAQVRLSDVVVPERYDAYQSVETKQKSAFFATGVLRPDAEISAKLAGGGLLFKVPFWKDLDDTESDAATDDPDDHASPDKLGTGLDMARRQFRTKGWSSMRLTQELAGSDPMARIGARTGAYWARQFDDIAIASVRGVFADNAANDAGDMINDDSTDAVGAPAAGELFNAEGFMDAAQTMGDAKAELNLVVMHSIVSTRLDKLDLIDFRPDSEGKILIPYYQGFRVHVSDKTTTVAGTNRVRYHTYLFGSNAIGWGESPPDMPVEVESVPSAGAGSGAETLWTRKQFAIHPYGVKWTEASVTGEFPSNAELRLAANWDRVYPERKQIPMALYITNG